MAAEIHPSSEATEAPKKRKFKHNKKTKKGMEASNRERSRPKKVRISMRMRNVFEKRAREYNSDDDNVESAPEPRGRNLVALGHEEGTIGNSSEEEGASDLDARGGDEEMRDSEDEEGDEIQPGITKFTEGCRAFRVSFLKIMKKNVSSDMIGPVLSGHKKLIAEKLAEDEAERKVKGEAKKEKHLMAEKGHVKPANFLDTKEKFLVSVATKGVVKLFNAVNKGQNAKKGLNPSRFKDAKALGKRRKEAFLAELQKTSDNTSINVSKGAKSTQAEDNDEPRWAPLRDSFMLTNSKLKDWDKMPDPATLAVPDEMSPEDSSDDD